MARYRNKLVYDAITGEIRDGRNYMSMLEDFGYLEEKVVEVQEITTLFGGQNLERLQI